jgi:hypothetical protein
MTKKVWQFSISEDMVKHLDINNELGLFFSALEDAFEEVCSNYDVEPWELVDND